MWDTHVRYFCDSTAGAGDAATVFLAPIITSQAHRVSTAEFETDVAPLVPLNVNFVGVHNRNNEHEHEQQSRDEESEPDKRQDVR